MASEAFNFQHLSADETVARSAVYPKHFDDFGTFSPNALIELDKLDGGKKPRYAISVASKLLLNNDEDLHAYGCRMANAKNARVFARHGIEAPLNLRNFYCGFYDIGVSNALNLRRPAYNVEVLLVPENGEDAHCEIRLIPDQTLGPSELKEARGDLLIDLIAQLSGPTTHKCQEDVKFGSIVDQIFLPKLPQISSENSA